MIIEESGSVRAVSSLRLATSRAVAESAARRLASAAWRTFVSLPPERRAGCVLLSLGIAAAGFAAAVWRMPPHEAPSLALAGGVLAALGCAALAAPFRQ